MAFSKWLPLQTLCVLLSVGVTLAVEDDTLFDFDKVDCGKNFTNASGSFSGELGDNATHCMWQVTLPVANQTATIFKLVKLSPGDFIAVYDGKPSTDGANLVVNITGQHDVFLALTFSKVFYIELIKAANTSISLNFSYSQDCTLGFVEYAYRVVSPSYLPSRGPVKCQYRLAGLPQAKDKVSALAFINYQVTDGNLTITDGKQTIGVKGIGSDLPDDYISPNTQDLISQLYLDISFSNSSTLQSFEVFFSSVDKKCSGVINATAGEDISIKIKADESPLTDCRMILMAQPGTTVLVNLTRVRLMEGADRVAIKDGGSLGSRAVTDLSSVPIDGYLVTSSTNRLWLRVVVGELAGERTLQISLSERVQGGRIYKDGNMTLKKNTTDDAIFYQFVSDKGQISINFSKALMYPNTSLNVYDGTQPDSPLLTSLSSQKQFFPITSSGSSLLLVARNFANQEKFTAQYQFLNQSCNKVSSGSSDSYTISATTEDLCRWTIRPIKSFGVVSLDVDALSLGMNETVTVYSGVMELGKVLATFDLNSVGQQLPSFRAPVNRGIELVYKSNSTCKNCSTPIISASYKMKKVCNGTLNGTTGALTSPGYPDSYSVNTDCRWTTGTTSNTTANTTSTSLLYLTFSDLQLGQGHSIKVKATKNTTAKVVANYKGSTLPDDIIVSGDSASVEFSSMPVPGSKSYQTGRGFKANYWNLKCGGNYSTTNATGGFTTPDWPKTVTNTTLCVWIIHFPGHGYNSTVRNSVQFKVVVSKQNKNMTNGALKIHDGGSIRDPLMHLTFKGGNSGTVLARTNMIVVVYNYTTASDENESGFAMALNFSAFSCGPDKQCGGDGVCIHPDWVCNGVDNCGDMSDERNCTTVNGNHSGLVNSYWIVICLILGLLFGVVLAFLIPAIYRRIKYPNYSQLRDLSAPVVT